MKLLGRLVRGCDCPLCTGRNSTKAVRAEEKRVWKEESQLDMPPLGSEWCHCENRRWAQRALGGEWCSDCWDWIRPAQSGGDQ